MNEREQLEQAIAALEGQRAILSDAVVNAALAPMREKLAALRAQQPAGQVRKQVTVLFADVSGFTAMSETLDPEEVSATMNALWARLDAAITAQGGTIDKHIGDAVMALFGAPTAHENDPERAIRAALAMQAELHDFTAAERLAVPLRMRIGINTGIVLLGAVGTTAEYTAMGDTVNLASRLEHAAPVGGILISHDSYRHVRGIFEVQSLDPISVKGKAEPVQVYVVRAAKPRAFRLSTRGVEGIETRTIGREAELRQLQLALFAARAGQAQLASVVAEAGVGKSRLLDEFNTWIELQAERTLLFRGRATQEMINLPYALIRNLLALQFEIHESDLAAVAREKLERGMREVLGAGAVEQVHFIAHLIGLDFTNSPYLQGIRADARQIHDRAFYYVARFFATVARQHPVVILLEDIHWADDGSLDLIEYILREQPEMRLLVVGLTRPGLFERRQGWGDGPLAHTRLDLHPLSEQHSRQLIAEILHKATEIPQQLEDLILSRVEGNPFYIEELIKMLIEDGVIVTGADRWSVELGRLATAPVPATLTGVLQARLDVLPPSEREILQQAAVVGRIFWSNVVERLRSPDVSQSAQASAPIDRLSALNRKELIFQRPVSSFAETHEYIFKHAILHDVTYESVLKRLRRAYHAQVAESLIELSGERAGEYAGRIGEHFERAGMAAQAAAWYGSAGQQARDTYATEAAITYYQKALALWSDTPEAAPAEQRFEVYEGLGDMLAAQARYVEALAVYGTMRQEAEAAGDSQGLARAWYGLALVQSYQGDHRAAIESAIQAEATAQAAGARNELALALRMHGWSLSRLGDAEAALALGQQMLALTIEIDDRRQMARSLNLLGIAYNMLGRYQQAAGCLEQALAICQALDDRRQVMDLLNNLGVIAQARGDHRAAFERFQAALKIARTIGHRDGELVFLSNLGEAHIRLGEYQAAEANLRQVIQMARAAGSDGFSDTYTYLAEAYLGQGNLADALAAGLHALGLGQSEGAQEYISAAWRVLGMLASHLPEPIVIEGQTGDSPAGYDAPACFTKSLHICAETGIEGERARTLSAWARHEIERGDWAYGTAMWQEARAIFAQLGAELEAQRMAEPPARAATT
jgi:class 3 adenylate cyclase/tetratricopeptide (TPR) repeat protein